MHQEVVIGTKAPEQACADAQVKIDAILAK